MSQLDPNYTTNIVNAINRCPDCVSLEKLIEETISDYLNKTLTLIDSNMNFLGPLTHVPTNLGEVITWITSYISHSILTPYNNLVLLKAEILTSYSAILAALVSKTASLTCAIVVVEGVNGIGGIEEIDSHSVYSSSSSSSRSSSSSCSSSCSSSSSRSSSSSSSSN